ncbi:MAG TPA: LuxR C-terminal-related transcriptional regulator [Thermoanaerobaculia bacterium]
MRTHQMPSATVAKSSSRRVLMQIFNETLDRVAHSGEAVFATDGADRIILWNKECEALLALPSRRAIGKPCYEVICGRDASDNIYCHRNCAVAFQAREKKEDPVRRFPLTVRTGDGKTRRISSAMFAIPSYHPALTTLVHVLRPEEAPQPASNAPEPLLPMAGPEGDFVALTPRETEILACLSHGDSTPAVARKLGIAAVTVRNHIQSILQKLEVHSKLEAVVLAQKRRII